MEAKSNKGDKNAEIDYPRILAEKYNIRKYAVVMTTSDIITRMHERQLGLAKNPKAFEEVVEICDEYIRRFSEIPAFPDFLPIFNVIGIKETIEFFVRAARHRLDYTRLRVTVLQYMKQCVEKQRYIPIFTTYT